MQVPPNFRKAWADTTSRIVFAVGGFICYKWEKQPPLGEVLSTADGAQHMRRLRVQDLVRHVVVLCGADGPPGRAPRGNLARELSKEIDSEKGKGKDGTGAFQASQIEITS